MQKLEQFETLRREFKADLRKQHDLYDNNLVGNIKANPKDFIGTSIVRNKPPLKKSNGSGVAQSESEKAT